MTIILMLDRLFIPGLAVDNCVLAWPIVYLAKKIIIISCFSTFLHFGLLSSGSSESIFYKHLQKVWHYRSITLIESEYAPSAVYLILPLTLTRQEEPRNGCAAVAGTETCRRNGPKRNLSANEISELWGSQYSCLAYRDRLWWILSSCLSYSKLD